MRMESQAKIVLTALMSLAGMAWAQPVVKTGDCPAFTRETPSENWNAFPIKPNGFPAGSVQKPVTPQQSINCIQVPAGLRAELWASELTTVAAPPLAYLQHFDFDERGRMWAVEPRAYPNVIRPPANSVTDQKFQGGTDRILILEDTNGDKVADKVTVFKDGLNMPQSILVVNGGVLVTMMPYVAFFPSVNDVAGTPQILFSGMGTRADNDTHGTISSLMYGLDNWIYGHTGYNECTTEGVNCGGGKVWRFRHPAIGHAEKKFENWTSGQANAWGFGQMEDGQIFQSAATGYSHISHSIRKGSGAVDVRYPSSGNNLFYPITGDRYMAEGSTGKNAQGFFTTTSSAVSGLQFYTSRLLPQPYWNRYAFACEGASKLCNQDRMVVTPNGEHTGSSWRAMRMPHPDSSNIIASTDAWVAPILAKTGPDGAVWVLDWYNYLFLHNYLGPVGDGNAWLNKLREKERVRIYRVTPADGRTEPILNLTNATVPELVHVLGNVNMHWRLQAQRLLLKKGYSAELGTLLEGILKTDLGVDAVGNNPRVLHAMWTLEGLGQFTTDAAKWNPILSGLLKHPAWGVRRNVPKVMPATTASATALNEQCSVNDTHGHVRLQVLIALAGISAKPAEMKAMWDTYKNVDGASGPNAHAASAFTPAGITSAATKPCEPALNPGTAFVPSTGTTGLAGGAVSQPRSDLRFSHTSDGFLLLPHGQLPSGELKVWDAHGRVVFRSGYEAAAQRWSQTRAQGLSKGVHFYAFQGVDGTRIQGRLGMAQP
jgi:putative membrane-bound dehydrogenase-like protein